MVGITPVIKNCVYLNDHLTKISRTAKIADYAKTQIVKELASIIADRDKQNNLADRDIG